MWNSTSGEQAIFVCLWDICETVIQQHINTTLQRNIKSFELFLQIDDTSLLLQNNCMCDCICLLNVPCRLVHNYKMVHKRSKELTRCCWQWWTVDKRLEKTSACTCCVWRKNIAKYLLNIFLPGLGSGQACGEKLGVTSGKVVWFICSGNNNQTNLEKNLKWLCQGEIREGDNYGS